jgi:cell wall-associated NlpC family hydrolase
VRSAGKVVTMPPVRRSLATLGVLACACAGCGQAISRPSAVRQPTALKGSTIKNTPSETGTPTTPQIDVSTLHAHPQAIEPTAGAVAPSAPSTSPAQAAPAEPAVVNVGPPEPGLPQPVPLSQVKRELAASGLSSQGSGATLTPDGLAIPPANAPPIIKAMIQAGNTIARLPYRYGGGHASFQDTAYDCSGSLSYVFASVGLLSTPVDSTQLMSMGDPGPGQWVTIYANPGHTFMEIAGLRFDTVALAETGSRWSSRPPDEPDLASYAVRHPVGL